MKYVNYETLNLNLDFGFQKSDVFIITIFSLKFEKSSESFGLAEIVKFAV